MGCTRDKGYYGAKKIMRAIHPMKNPMNQLLCLEKASESKKISSDLIITENVFGRMYSLWAVVSTRYRWKLEWYNHFMRLCIALTNYHIERNPICASDTAFYDKLKKKVYSIGIDQAKKRRLAQTEYRERRRQRLENITVQSP